MNNVNTMAERHTNTISENENTRGRRGHDRMVVGFTTTYANQFLSPLML